MYFKEVTSKQNTKQNNISQHAVIYIPLHTFKESQCATVCIYKSQYEQNSILNMNNIVALNGIINPDLFPAKVPHINCAGMDWNGV